MTNPEAQGLLAEIAVDKRKIQRLMNRIKERQGRLEAIVIEVFNEVSEPINGIVLDPGEATIGYRECKESPIGVCCYSDRVVCLPSQRGRDVPDDGCLFCGTAQDA